MSKSEKLMKRLLNVPKDFTYTEATTLLKQLGFSESNKGKTSGSRVRFFRGSDQCAFLLHKPHPGDVLPVAFVRQLAEFVKNL